MIDEKQASILRPKPVPPMFTPVLTPSTQSMNMNPTSRGPSQAVIEMGSMIRKYDPEATRLFDCIAQVKLFSYNSTELRWENSPNIEGNLCAYERQQVINNKTYPSYAFAIFCGEKSLIQPVTPDMAHQTDKLRLFYEVARNGRREVFCLHFVTEAECLRLHTFLTRCVQTLKTLAEQQARAMQAAPPAPVPVDPQQTQLNGQGSSAPQLQQTPTNVYRQQMMAPNQTTPQYASRVNMNPTPTRLVSAPIPPPQMPIDLNNLNLQRVTPTVNQNEMPKPLEQTPFPPSPVPLANGNNSEDPTSSLKRLLNIRGQSGLEGLSLEDTPVPKQQPPQQHPQQQQQPPPPQFQQNNPLDLMPPSAFEPIAATPPSPVVAIGAERVKHRLPAQFNPPMTREHFRSVLLHLVQTDDHFLDIIYQACLNYPTQ